MPFSASELLQRRRAGRRSSEGIEKLSRFLTVPLYSRNLVLDRAVEGDGAESAAVEQILRVLDAED